MTTSHPTASPSAAARATSSTSAPSAAARTTGSTAARSRAEGSTADRQADPDPDPEPDTGPATTRETKPNGRRSEPAASAVLTRAVVLSLVSALLVLVAGGLVVLTRSSTYEASVDVLVSPVAGATDADAASLFDTLSKGQVAATAAEIYRQPQWRGDRVGTVEAGVITPSAVIQVVGRASSAAEAQELVLAVLAAADPTVNRVLDPYRVDRLDTAAPSTAPVGLSRPLQLALVLLAALVAGGAVLHVTRPRSKVAAA